MLRIKIARLKIFHLSSKNILWNNVSKSEERSQVFSSYKRTFSLSLSLFPSHAFYFSIRSKSKKYWKSVVKIKNTYVSQVLKIENDCVHHPRNSVTLDASVAFDKFDRKRKERKRKKNNVSSEISTKRGNDCKISRLCLYYIRIPFWHSKISTGTDSTL